MDKYFCTDCGQIFHNEDSLYIHNRNRHDISRFIEVFEKILIDYEQRQTTQEAKDHVLNVKTQMLQPMKVKYTKIDLFKKIREKIKNDVAKQRAGNLDGKGPVVKMKDKSK